MCQLQEEKERGQCVLRFSDFLSPVQESCRPSSKRTLFHSVFLYLSAYPPHLHSLSDCPHLYTHILSLSFHMKFLLTPLFSPLPHTLTLSGSVKSDRLQVCFTVEEDSLLLYACNLSAWHSTSPKLLYCNLSWDPIHTSASFMHAGLVVILFIINLYFCINSELWLTTNANVCEHIKSSNKLPNFIHCPYSDGDITQVANLWLFCIHLPQTV